MKKILSLAFITIFCLSAFAQDDTDKEQFKPESTVKVSLDLGSTLGDDVANSMYNLNLGFNFAYLHDLTKDVEIGVTTGLKKLFDDDSYNSSETYVEPKKGYLYLGAEVRLYTDNDKFYLGGDAGWTAGLFDQDGSFYYRPKFGFVICNHSGVFVSYSEVDGDNDSFSTVNVGYEFTF